MGRGTKKVENHCFTWKRDLCFGSPLGGAVTTGRRNRTSGEMRPRPNALSTRRLLPARCHVTCRCAGAPPCGCRIGLWWNTGWHIGLWCNSNRVMMEQWVASKVTLYQIINKRKAWEQTTATIRRSQASFYLKHRYFRPIVKWTFKSVALLSVTQQIKSHNRPKATIRPQWNAPCKQAIYVRAGQTCSVYEPHIVKPKLQRAAT